MVAMVAMLAARDPAETERNRVLMHPLRIVRKDGNAFIARKTSVLKWIRVRLTEYPGVLGPPPEGLPAPEPGQYSEPKNSPSTLWRAPRQTNHGRHFSQEPDGVSEPIAPLKG